jgi:hypothetical protein
LGLGTHHAFTLQSKEEIEKQAGAEFNGFRQRDERPEEDEPEGQVRSGYEKSCQIAA